MIVEQTKEQTPQPERAEPLATKQSGPVSNDVRPDTSAGSTQPVSPADVLANYQLNRLVKPADVDVMGLRALEDQLLAVLNAFGYTPVELSPVAPVGTCSALGASNPDRVLLAAGQTEVVSDAATALALSVASQRNAHPNRSGSHNDWFRCSTLHRSLRQALTPDASDAGPHTKMACFITAGRSLNNYQFEQEAVAEHATMITLYLRDILLFDELTFRLYPYKGYRHPATFVGQLSDYLRQQPAEIRVEVGSKKISQSADYKGLHYKLIVTVNGQPTEVGSGGFVDWTQQFLQDKKERLLTTTVNIELLHNLIKDEAGAE